jgi:hypothetical protein
MSPTEENRKKAARLSYEWCIKFLKKSKYHSKVPKLIIRSNFNKDFKGYYKEEKNLIVIFIKSHNSTLDICRTIIHEWKHYQQNMSMYDKYIIVYKRNLKNHPYEITAENFARKHGLSCRKWINYSSKNK